VFTLGRFLISPLWTLYRYRWTIGTGLVLVVSTTMVLELHDWITVWPGTVMVCVVFAYLIRKTHAPRSVFHIVSGIANNVQIWNERQLDRIFRFFRSHDTSFEDVVEEFELAEHATTGREGMAATARAWESEDSAAWDTQTNVIGWFIAWQCLLLILHAGNLFRVFYIHYEHAFDIGTDGRLDPTAGWAWLLFSVDRLLFESELTFDLYDIYGIENNQLWGYQTIQHSTAVSHVLFFFHITISVLLANTIFSHFAFTSNVQRLLRTVCSNRFDERIHNKAYQSLRVLRPLIERQFIRTLKGILAREKLREMEERGEWRRLRYRWRILMARAVGSGSEGWVEALTIVSLLRTRGARRQLMAVMRNPGAPLQVRLAATESLIRSGVQVEVADVSNVMEEIDDCCRPEGKISDYGVRAVLEQSGDRGPVGGKRRLEDYDVLRRLLHDLMELLELLGPETIQCDGQAQPSNLTEAVCALRCGRREGQTLVRQGREGGNLLAIAAEAMEAPCRYEALVSFSYRPRWATPLTAEFCRRKLMHRPLDRGERAVFAAARRLLERREPPAAVAAGITAERIAGKDRPLITAVLLRVLGTERRRQHVDGLVDALARVGEGREALLVVARAWKDARDPHRWRTLLAGMERLRIRGDEALQTVVETIAREDLREDLRNQVWRVLCRHLPPDEIETHFQLPTRVNSLSTTLRRVAGGHVRIKGTEYQVASFWIADFPVRVSEWLEFVRETQESGSVAVLPADSDRTRALLEGKEDFSGPETPVVEVNWWDAEAFCEWLTVRERNRGVLGDDEVYRLPTEAEWTAMAEASAETGFWYDVEYHDTMTNHRGARGPHRPSPRGEFFPNARGVFDVHGNVWEWCLNEYDARDVQTRPPTDSGIPRTLKGGSWRSPIEACSATVRAGWAPGAHLDHVGFRIVLSTEVAVRRDRFARLTTLARDVSGS